MYSAITEAGIKIISAITDAVIETVKEHPAETTVVVTTAALAATTGYYKGKSENQNPRLIGAPNYN